MDKLTPARRSENMRRIRSRDTAPEIAARRCIFSLGYRYRLHDRSLPGKPDLVLKQHRVAIFIHGCFWHQHGHCIDSHIPESRRDYWKPKLHGNQKRDRKNQQALKRLGWRILVIWECETKKPEILLRKIRRFFTAAL